MQAEGEVGRGEVGERLDEDVGDGFVFGEMGVKLIAVISSATAKETLNHRLRGSKRSISDRANKNDFSGRKGFNLRVQSGNRKRVSLIIT